METGRLNSITDWATGKWTSSHYGEMHTPAMNKTPRNHSLCHAQVKGQEGLDNVPVMCVCSESRRGPHTRPPSAHWAYETTCGHKPRVLGEKGGDTRRPCKEPVDSIPDGWEHVKHVHRMCGKLSAATQSRTGEPEEADHANHHQGDGEIKQQSPTKEECTAWKMSGTWYQV